MGKIRMGQTQIVVAKNMSICNCSSVEHLKCVHPQFTALEMRKKQWRVNFPRTSGIVTEGAPISYWLIFPLSPVFVPEVFAKVNLACEQALLFGRVKRVSRERASEQRSFACPNRSACLQVKVNSVQFPSRFSSGEWRLSLLLPRCRSDIGTLAFWASLFPWNPSDPVMWVSPLTLTRKQIA